ncbi:hypothetical protein KB213_11780 [Neokomagataea sp. TBRC 2177]|uniref:Uncharacterized protein n=1 Tax=Neokomagataea anthophila TaxID=2826925 RepID=A0ABS5EA04_9PROT|nr:hypothetical protein [Neokomagataea anthophila]
MSAACTANAPNGAIYGIWTKSGLVIGGHVHWLWRAVDQDGYILDEILQ